MRTEHYSLSCIFHSSYRHNWEHTGTKTKLLKLSSYACKEIFSHQPTIPTLTTHHLLYRPPAGPADYMVGHFWVRSAGLWGTNCRKMKMCNHWIWDKKASTDPELHNYYNVVPTQSKWNVQWHNTLCAHECVLNYSLPASLAIVGRVTGLFPVTGYVSLTNHATLCTDKSILHLKKTETQQKLSIHNIMCSVGGLARPYSSVHFNMHKW